MAMEEYLSHLGKLVRVNSCMGYILKDSVDHDCPDEPAIVRVCETGEDSILRWMDDECLDPIWDAEIVQYGSLPRNMRSCWIYGTTYKRDGDVEPSAVIEIVEEAGLEQVHEYAFDITLLAVCRVKAENEKRARDLLRELVSTLDIGTVFDVRNQPEAMHGEEEVTLTEATMEGEGDMYDVDGEDPDEGEPEGPPETDASHNPALANYPFGGQVYDTLKLHEIIKQPVPHDLSVLGECDHNTVSWKGRSPWECDEVQFPRLLAEIMATQDNLDFSALTESMDLPVEMIDELFDRAQEAWEMIKQATCSGARRQG